MSQPTSKFISRVDVQVALLTTLFSLCSSLFVYVLCYQITYASTIATLEDRVYALYDIVEKSLDMSTFRTIHTPEDVETESYQIAHDLLENLKDASGVLYLYTAMENHEGDFVYVIDGLSMEEDFRYPGDLIEYEIVDEMQLALTGEHIIPDRIVHTEWGDIFVTYLPLHDRNGEIIGVIGIEFEAGETYRTYNFLESFAPIICIGICIVAALVSYRVFRRISNPFYKDLATTDAPTRLKNRNAFEVDMNNFLTRGHAENIGIIAGDLNKLKYVNDNFGHNRGDDYIRLIADTLRESSLDNMFTYRVGGDEFAVIARNSSKELLQEFIKICGEKIEQQQAFRDFTPSMSFGYAMFQKDKDKTLSDTYARADAMMYENKRALKDKESMETQSTLRLPTQEIRKALIEAAKKNQSKEAQPPEIS